MPFSQLLGLLENGRLHPSALIRTDAVGAKKVHPFFVRVATAMIEMLFEGGLFLPKGHRLPRVAALSLAGRPGGRQPGYGRQDDLGLRIGLNNGRFGGRGRRHGAGRL